MTWATKVVLHRATLGSRPVLVMANVDQQVIAVQGGRVFQIRGDGVVKPITSPLGPLDEAALETEPARGANGGRKPRPSVNPKTQALRN